MDRRHYVSEINGGAVGKIEWRNRMKIVLFSGGSGKRLWPLSNDSRSKQFLKILKNGDGGLESMIHRVWGQLEEANLQAHLRGDQQASGRNDLQPIGQ